MQSTFHEFHLSAGAENWILTEQKLFLHLLLLGGTFLQILVSSFSPENIKMSHTFQILVSLIIEASESDSWSAARKEWRLDTIYEQQGETCLCGHYPITDNCVIINKKNQNVVTVGNVCIKHFLSDRNRGGVEDGDEDEDDEDDSDDGDEDGKDGSGSSTGGNDDMFTVPSKCFRSLSQLHKNPDDTTASKALIELATRLKILSKQDAHWYNKLTRGKGARKHFDRHHPRFSEKKYQIRKAKNAKLLQGFRKP